MLNIRSTTSPPVLRQDRPPTVNAVIAASNIAKAHRPIHERARLAALWVCGRLLIERRTAALAALIFGVSAPSVSRALAEFGGATVDMSMVLDHYWNCASNDERRQFVRSNLIPIWDQVERITR
jgi:hypothetical protein